MTAVIREGNLLGAHDGVEGEAVHEGVVDRPADPAGYLPRGVWRFVATYAVHVPEAGGRDRATALASRWAVADALAEP